MVSANSCSGWACAAATARLFTLPKRRSFRVITLVSMIAVMSVADLYLTLLYVTNSGMNEMNPFARAVMEFQSPIVLAAWKLGTVALSLGILLFIRKKRSAEVGAWIGCCVLGWLMVHWVGFVEVSEETAGQIVQINEQMDPSWILMEADAGLGNLVID